MANLKFDSRPVNAPKDGDYEDRPQVDYTAMNKHVVDTVGCPEGKTKQGVVVGIIDLGVQQLPDAEYDLEGADEVGKTIAQLNEFFADKIADGSITKFAEVPDYKNKGKTKIVKVVPQKPCQCVDLVVDFPNIIVDKGQFAGESNPQPYRQNFGGSFYFKKADGTGEMRLQRPIKLKLTKDANIGWTITPLNILYKLAVAGGLIKKGEPFLPDQIGELLGVNAQFKITAKGSQVGDKYYLNERIAFVDSLLEEFQTPITDQRTFMVLFNSHDNEEKDLKELRFNQINQIKYANDYEGSVIQSQLEAQRSGNQDKPQNENGGSVKVETSDPSEDLPF